MNLELNIFEIMRDKVLRGEDIVVAGELGNVQGQLHGAMVDRLLRDTGKPVVIRHVPAPRKD